MLDKWGLPKILPSQGYWDYWAQGLEKMDRAVSGGARRGILAVT